jgi:cytochrome c553
MTRHGWPRQRPAWLCTVLAASFGALVSAVSAQPSPARSGGAAGQQIAAQGTAAGVPACASCHGARGEGAAAFPRLAGTGQAYLREQLDAFAEGSRKSAVMQPFAQKLSAQERAAVAAYYSALPPPFTGRDPSTVAPDDRGAWLATRGRWRDEVPGCAQCHGPGGSGVGASFPPLAGLPAGYLLAELQAFKAGTRPAGPLGLMQAVARRLSQADMEAVSSYYAGLGRAVPAQDAASAPRGGRQ